MNGAAILKVAEKQYYLKSYGSDTKKSHRFYTNGTYNIIWHK